MGAFDACYPGRSVLAGQSRNLPNTFLNKGRLLRCNNPISLRYLITVDLFVIGIKQQNSRRITALSVTSSPLVWEQEASW